MFVSTDSPSHFADGAAEGSPTIKGALLN